MIIDIRSLSNNSTISCDLCIIGGGAAGITLALEFIDSGVDVVLLESGGLEIDEDTQSLYQGEDVGLPYFDIEAIRMRFLGGNTNLWGGWSRPLEPIDFETRDWIAHSGWPISYSEYAAYLPRANTILQIPDYNYDAFFWLEHEVKSSDRTYIENETIISNFNDFFQLGTFQFSPPTVFGEVYRSALKNAQNIKTFLYANVTSIDTQGNPNIVDQLDVRTLEGQNFKIKTKQVILATGGIENARILLASNKTHPNGIGNNQDLVGRYFADHPELESGYVLSKNNNDALSLFANRYEHARFSLDVSPETQCREKMVNIGLTLHNVPNMSQSADGLGAARRIKKSILRGDWPDNFFSDIGKAIINIDDVLSYLNSKEEIGKEGLFMITSRVEPQPNPESRVTLSNTKDALGIPITKINWQLSEIDYNSIYKMQSSLAQIIGKSGYGHVNIELGEKFKRWPDVTDGGYHHMGTTRMADNHKTGVVDKNCKVFGLENLYIAGSSVFPTYGKANPTLNLVALTLKLADHLKTKMGVKG